MTDVDAILGYLNPRFFAGGRTSLDIDGATQIFAERVAEPLGLPPIDAAASIYRMANSIFFDLLHKITVRRGIDPRGFALFSYGGTAGMHAYAYGLELGVDPIVVPHAAAVQGAYGLVISNVVHEEQITHPMSVPVGLADVNEILRALRDKVEEQLRADGFADDRRSIEYYVDMQYRRQVHILTVPLWVVGDETPDLVSHDAIEEAVTRFEELYREKYGPESGYRAAGIELVTFRARGVGVLPKHKPQPEPLTSVESSDALVETRKRG